MLKRCGIGQLPVVYRLRKQGMPLGTREALLGSGFAFGAAVAAALPGAHLGDSIYVLDDHDLIAAGFLRVRRRDGRPESDLAYIAPRLTDEPTAAEEIWKRLLTSVGLALGQQGVQRVYAGLPESTHELTVFQEAGFINYTREDLFVLREWPALSAASTAMMELRRPEHEWGLQRLYNELVPRLVQQAEAGLWPDSPAATDLAGEAEHILADGSEVIGRVRTEPGERVHWLFLMLHPRAYPQARAAIARGLGELVKAGRRPVCCVVREYQGGLRTPLEDMGFEWVGRQALLVKHTAVRVREAQPRVVPAMETRPEAAVPSALRCETNRTTGN